MVGGVRIQSSLETLPLPIKALTVLLEARGVELILPELRRLRRAVAVLAQKRNPRQEDVRPLFSAWGVKQRERQTYRRLDVDRRAAASGSRGGHQTPRQWSRHEAGK